ncbi:MAG TPA: DUF6290 family protein [Candidatus Babeliales bacterium]|jgi:uncharacterized protein (DUF1778 family)|nr:DUF6290 family protein [Candidatus Babeliales bacterium]
MPTKNPRINITIEPETQKLLSVLAHQEQRSVSSLATELILEALERREDIGLSTIAQERDTEEMEIVSHDDIWK